MRILQIIDSLDAGGAERMAVSYANVLVDTLGFSALVTTRKEGPLLNQIDSKVTYLFLNKKKQIDFGALWRLRLFIIQNSITHIHAHSTSFFIAFLLKLFCPYLKLMWHYHYGNDKIISSKRILIFKIIIPFFNGVIVVNQNLKIWIENKLKLKKVIYLPNFAHTNKETKKTILFGVEGKQIVSLANLRPDKNHFLLLEVANQLKKSHPDWTFHLVGKDFEDAYSIAIKNKIKELQLENQVFLYGSRTDVSSILNQSTIGILTSESEGLPVALLEYGMHQLPVVVTSVGEIPSIVSDGVNGYLVSSHDVVSFNEALITLISDVSMRNKTAHNLHQKILEDFSSNGVLKKYIQWLAQI